MITFKPCVTYKRRDGTYAVRIRVTFARSSRYLPTTLTAYPAQLTRSGKLRDPALIAAADNLVRDLREAASTLNPFALEGRSVDWVCDYLKMQLRGSSFRLNIFTFADEWLEGRNAGTAEVYRSTLNVLARWLGGRELDVNDIDGRLLRDFAASLPSAGNAARHLSRFATIFSAARRRYNTGDEVLIPRTPFDSLDRRIPHPQGQRSLGIEGVQRIIDARPADELQAVALAVFVVCFGTMGANFADLWAAPSFTGSRWCYERRKTRDRRADRARVEVEIDPRLAYHLSLLRGRGRWWLPVLHRGGEAGDRNRINHGLELWAQEQGLERFTLYAARHSWATIARSLGVEKATVDEGLAHVGDFRVADIYAERDWAQINAANRRVLDAFSWAAD